MNELDRMKMIWKQENSQRMMDFPSIQPIVSGKLTQKLELFQRENGFGTSITGAIVMILMAAMIGGLAWKKGEFLGFAVSVGLLFIAAGMIHFARRWRSVSLHKPEQNMRLYLESRYSQLRLLKWLSISRVFAGLSVGAFFFILGDEDPFSGGPLSNIGILAFVLLAIFLITVIFWWYRTQHPYRPQELRKELRELINQFEE